MKYGYTDNKDAVSKRLNRIEGQIRGINKMVQDDTYCIDILTQVSAAQSALKQVALELLSEHAKHCMMDGSLDAAQREQKSKELVTAVGRLV